MSKARAVAAASLLVLGLSPAASSSAAEYERLEMKPAVSLAGDFAGLASCSVEGEHRLVHEAGRSGLLAESDLRIASKPALALPYRLSLWVRLAGKRGPGGKAVLTAATSPRGGYQVELIPWGDWVDIRASANGCNLWAHSTCHYGEGRGVDSLRLPCSASAPSACSPTHGDGGSRAFRPSRHLSTASSASASSERPRSVGGDAGGCGPDRLRCGAGTAVPPECPVPAAAGS